MDERSAPELERALRPISKFEPRYQVSGDIEALTVISVALVALLKHHADAHDHRLR
jgi:hypothetical protein